MKTATNMEPAVVRAFGEEWSRFDQVELSHDDFRRLFTSYFEVFPWERLPRNAQGFDLGCGSGRWARGVAPRVGKLHCIDPSEAALAVAKRNLRELPNCSFHQASVDAIPLADASMDFGYSLGVLHHVPDTLAAIRSCTRILKPGAPFLVYLYYAFDNRPFWFRGIWKMSDIIRRCISRMPRVGRQFVCDLIALGVYYPLARAARLPEHLGQNVDNWPLSAYRNMKFYVMRTDALDRFGTRLEQRFTQKQIEEMLEASGLTSVQFSTSVPFWTALAYKK